MFVLSVSISLLFPLPFSQQISPRMLIKTVNELRFHGHQRLGICRCSQRIHLVYRLALASIGGHVAELLVDVSVDLVVRVDTFLHGVQASTGVVCSVLLYYTPEPQSSVCSQPARQPQQVRRWSLEPHQASTLTKYKHNKGEILNTNIYYVQHYFQSIYLSIIVQR